MTGIPNTEDINYREGGTKGYGKRNIRGVFYIGMYWEYFSALLSCYKGIVSHGASRGCSSHFAEYKQQYVFKQKRKNTPEESKVLFGAVY